MKPKLQIEILPQPNDTTCGPTSLHAVYRYYGERISLEKVISEVKSLDEGGTMAVLLACHALGRGYKATIYTYNLQIFDPTWFVPKGPDIRERLALRLQYTDAPKMKIAIRAYLEFYRLGGTVRFEDLRTGLLRKYLSRSVPILTGLSSTYLYKCPREYGPHDVEDDVRGDPQGHFVVLCGYNKKEKKVLVADPYQPNPISGKNYYDVEINRLLNSILLGIVTYDANLLIIEPSEKRLTHRK